LIVYVNYNNINVINNVCYFFFFYKHIPNTHDRNNNNNNSSVKYIIIHTVSLQYASETLRTNINFPEIKSFSTTTFEFKIIDSICTTIACYDYRIRSVRDR